MTEGARRDKFSLPDDYPERVYAGWLGKVIGVRHGGNIEQWTQERIERAFGEITEYVHHFKNFAADDDTNGPLFFLRALEDYTHTREITPEQMGLAWLNYAPEGHGFFWWGGYGKSTEHTAYVNLRNGIMAPESGSIRRNGATVAEQIGGQIFSETWGLIAPGQPVLAAEYACKMASVSHDGEGKYGGMFVAACVAAAFIEVEIEEIIEAGLSVIPASSRYAEMTRDVMRIYRERPADWRQGFAYVHENYGYDKYPGVCHIIPNAAVVVLSLLYGEGDFSRSINICNMCGWDTDCNVANVGTILGVKNGLQGMDAAWRKPINDFLCCSSVIGSLNILDLPWCASYIARFGYLLSEQPVPEAWRFILDTDRIRCHFEYPGSTHAFKTEADHGVEASILNVADKAYSGTRSLRIMFDKVNSGCGYRTYLQTYYGPEDFNDSRYDPAFSPILYPGQTVACKAMVPSGTPDPMLARLYVHDCNSGHTYYGPKTMLLPNQWESLEFRVPQLHGACLDRAGVEWIPLQARYASMIAYLDDFEIGGAPDYTLDFSKERIERWNGVHQEVSQLTYLRGIWTLEEGELSASYAGEPAEAYTGQLHWSDLDIEAELVPKLGHAHMINFRVQGAIRSYAFGLGGSGAKAVLLKNDNGYRELASWPYAWRHGDSYKLVVKMRGNHFAMHINDDLVLEFTDDDRPYGKGMVGFSSHENSHTHYKYLTVHGAGDRILNGEACE
ncbi:ADP-ribosylglycohydrolase family protein [Cohnella hashimotonis]|uniref:ADP-ribosylglycohydrolase family protein n=1 Tax=Cohnella hashimotonis TaxID=2826895 RepID=A0ABT6TH37_9BACL|nr:ADP-ribosylglycohydrolase family protein [Cohnella hashimotonis]MDI4645147.1 ADP-ribosylglycohydrolase family protein [Cohnella hashimotonis]